MNVCSLKRKSEYQTLQKMSGISEFNLDSFLSTFYEENQRFPELDEVPNVNSEKYLNTALNVKGKTLKTIKTEDLLNYTGVSSVQEANIILNNQYRDLEIKITQLNEKSLIEVNHRPSKYKLNDINKDINPLDEKTKQDQKFIITKLLIKLSNLYGINIIPISNAEIQEKFNNIIPNAQITNGFVYNGNIYINVDVANVDTPIHEMLHIFIGGIKYQDPNLYYELINSIEELPMYDVLSRNYPNRTKGDINEEIFISEFAKYLTNQESIFNKLSTPIINKITYNITRIIDSSFMGTYSAQSFDNNQLSKSTIEQIAELLESDITTLNYIGSLDDAMQHRIAANIKQKMLENNELTQICK